MFVLWSLVDAIHCTVKVKLSWLDMMLITMCSVIQKPKRLDRLQRVYVCAHMCVRETYEELCKRSMNVCACVRALVTPLWFKGNWCFTLINNLISCIRNLGWFWKKNLKNIVGGHYDRIEQWFKMLNRELSVNMLRIPCLFKIVLFCLKINFEYNHVWENAFIYCFYFHLISC